MQTRPLSQRVPRQFRGAGGSRAMKKNKRRAAIKNEDWSNSRVFGSDLAHRLFTSCLSHMGFVGPILNPFRRLAESWV